MKAPGRPRFVGALLTSPSHRHRQLVFKPADLVADDKELVRRNQDPVQRALARRPNYGKEGELFGCRTNFYKMVIGQATFFLYQIHISPEVKDRRKKKLVVAQAEEDPQFKVLMTSTALDFPCDHVVSKVPLDFSIVVDFESIKKLERFTISFREIHRFGTDVIQKYTSGHLPGLSVMDLEMTITAINIILAKYPRKNPSLWTIGKHKYFPVDGGSAFQLSPTTECIRGYYTSVRTLNSGVTMNVNISSSAFTRSGVNLLFLMEQWATERGPGSRLTDLVFRKDVSLIRFIRGLLVRTDQLTRGDLQILTVAGISDTLPADALYWKTRVSVVDYLQKRIPPIFSPPTPSPFPAGVLTVSFPDRLLGTGAARLSPVHRIRNRQRSAATATCRVPPGDPGTAAADGGRKTRSPALGCDDQPLVHASVRSRQSHRDASPEWSGGFPGKHLSGMWCPLLLSSLPPAGQPETICLRAFFSPPSAPSRTTSASALARR